MLVWSKRLPYDLLTFPAYGPIRGYNATIRIGCLVTSNLNEFEVNYVKTLVIGLGETYFLLRYVSLHQAYLFLSVA